MNNIISKFNLYELFRILLPGSYFAFIILDAFHKHFSLYLNNLDSFGSILLFTIFSLILGTIVYGLDICRWFKNKIIKMPTNLLEEKHSDLYPNPKKPRRNYQERRNEHKYYEWYENATINSKTKTELQSGLYHLSINFAFVSVWGIGINIIIAIINGKIPITFYNPFSLFVLSSLAALVIVKRRLRHQWERNFWEYEDQKVYNQLDENTI